MQKSRYIISGLCCWLLMSVAQLGGEPCQPTGVCDLQACTPKDVKRYKCCVFDRGCWLNPWQPDNQWWCEDVITYECKDPKTGRTYNCRITANRWECGPCCKEAGGVVTP